MTGVYIHCAPLTFVETIYAQSSKCWMLKSFAFYLNYIKAIAYEHGTFVYFSVTKSPYVPDLQIKFEN